MYYVPVTFIWGPFCREAQDTNCDCNLFDSAATSPRGQRFHSLWTNNTICWHISGSTLSQIIACCLTAPSNYLDQGWLTIKGVQWHPPDSNIISVHDFFKNYYHISRGPMSWYGNMAMYEQRSLAMLSSRKWVINSYYIPENLWPIRGTNYSLGILHQGRILYNLPLHW